ncbi:cold-shock protein [Pseudomonas fluvialis]|uniref:Cold-shock protein n=1 Tax=Pseudomonas fluvialis TaxID=1793966 RepID=A0ABQ2AB06_9PSED|nr:cold-shock protein [Pseudomonas fluvialis]GGH88889.1 cold-shock protein [Pseudomonas fluvialis]
MLKIVHLLTGACALLLAAILTLQTSNEAPLQDSSLLALGLLALSNLIVSGLTHSSLTRLQQAGSLLLVVATLTQALDVLLTLPLPSNLPALLLLAIASLCYVLRLPSPQRAPRSRATPSQNTNNNAGGLRESGTVKWFNTSKGFGFISRDSGDDIFVHFRAIRGDGHRILVEGQRVEFVVMQRDKGLQAEDVVIDLPGRR